MSIKTYTVKEAAEIFETSVATIRREIERNKLRCFYVGNEARFTMIHLEDYANVRELGKTTRELELEGKLKELEVVVQDKDKLIDNIKNLLLKGSA